MIDDETGTNRGQLYRIAWKYRRSGATGSGPWMQDRETVEIWLETLTRRYSEQLEHWVESVPAESLR
ncbi:MAG: hypothetical protein ACREMQ_13010 [Longimicrobiales bacterium]